jgi:AbrB family looped-hinge helix DNA binding protein
MLLHNSIMKRTVHMDKLGRIWVPKAIRDRLGLSPGVTLDVELREGSLVLSAVPTGRMKKVNGVWLLQSRGGSISAKLVRRVRADIYREREKRWMDNNL